MTVIAALTLGDEMAMMMVMTTMAVMVIMSCSRRAMALILRPLGSFRSEGFLSLYRMVRLKIEKFRRRSIMRDVDGAAVAQWHPHDTFCMLK